ncbi:Hsp70 protein that interacts with Zuo1p [Neophaeococcomyces mojaviensis]|uniref:Hsp70 protein that interacts with Zuo1p n=1 Tax=Neophaeococcomyces mojaviensis TaxID=3383035 RepID=A0ACC3A7E4_9EURO|nr:Hsp70 protein that interacts with Zuo1p [Knufia sp. JES_112]
MSDETNGTSSPEQYAIGLSFGNSYSSIAHISQDGKVEVIANEEGDRQIPSILSYVDGEEYHGTQAKAQLVRNAKNTIASFKDYIGKPYKSIDPTPCHYSAHPTESDGKVVFTVQDKEGDATSNVSVSEVTTRHIKKLRASAADFTGKNITSAVVTVPTDTTTEQKAALAKAAKDANVEILQFINEPIAALLAYDSRMPEAVQDRIILVADFGGTRSDAAVVVATGGGLYSILATLHDYELGGSNLDQVLIDHFAKEFEKKNKTDPRKNDRSLAKLKLESEAVKKALSQSAAATCSIESLADGVDFRSTINRTRFQLLSVKVFQRFTRMIEEIVKKAGLDVLNIDEVILSGGTSHVPKIAENIQALFPESVQVFAPATSTAALNPSELSARGAAIQASMIQEFDKEDIEQSTHEMVTVTPHTQYAIGVQVTGDPADAFTVIVPSTTAVPARKTKTINAPEGDVLVVVSEGESDIKVTKPEPKTKTKGATVEDADDEDDDDDDEDEEDEEEEIREKVYKVKKQLAEFQFTGLKKGAKLEVTVNVDSDLGLSITAREAKGKGGVRGALEKPKVTENGSA